MLDITVCHTTHEAHLILHSFHLIVCHSDTNRDEHILDREQPNLHKTQKAHAEKQVQVATDCANQVVYSQLSLLFHLLIGERVQVEDEPKQVFVLVVDKIRLVGAEGAKDRVCTKCLVGIEWRGWKDV